MISVSHPAAGEGVDCTVKPARCVVRGGALVLSDESATKVVDESAMKVDDEKATNRMMKVR